METTWKPIAGYENEYSVSDKGDVKRIKSGRGAIAGKVLKPYLNKVTGYQTVTLSKNCIQTDFAVHRLVAVTFLGENTLPVNHKNGVKTDNRIDNLEFVTQQENLLHATKVLNLRCGEKHWNSRLTPKDVLKIRELKGSVLTHQQIADVFGVSRPTISEILIGRKWKCLPMPLVSCT